MTLPVDGGPTTSQLPICTGRKVFQRLHTIRAKRLKHQRCQTFKVHEAIFNTSSAGSFHRLVVDRLQMFAGTCLQFTSSTFVDTLNDQQFIKLNISDFFKGREPFGNKQLGKEFVQIKRFHEQPSAQFKLGLTTLGFFFFGHDVDSQTSQLRRKTHVLTTTANRQRQLLFWNNNFDLASFFIQNNL